MTEQDEFEKWLEEWEIEANDRQEYSVGGLILATKMKYRAFKEKQKPTAPSGLVEEAIKDLVNIYHDGCGCECCHAVEKEVKAIVEKLSRYSKEAK